MKTYHDIYREFSKKFPNYEVEDYRPADLSLVLKEVNCTIPNAIIVWLKTGEKLVYVSKEEGAADMPNSLKCKVKHLCHNGTITERERDRIIKALEQEPCEDCISREHLLEEIASLKESPWFKDDTNCAMAIRKEAIEIVEDLCIRKEPSINPQKTGHWIYDRTRDWDGECKYECSECGMGSDVDYAYCMRCGAKMIEQQERSDKE